MQAETSPRTQSAQSTRFLDVIYNGLFAPVSLYSSIANNWPRQSVHLFYATGFVFTLSTLGKLLAGSVNTFDFTTILAAGVAGVFGLLIWLLTGGTFSALAYCFRSQGRPFILLTLLGYASLPWILLAPLFLIRENAGLLGGALHLVGIFILWLWTTTLFLIALQKTYHLTTDRVLLMGLIPVLMGTLGLLWLFGGLGSLFTLLG